MSAVFIHSDGVRKLAGVRTSSLDDYSVVSTLQYISLQEQLCVFSVSEINHDSNKDFFDTSVTAHSLPRQFVGPPSGHHF